MYKVCSINSTGTEIRLHIVTLLPYLPKPKYMNRRRKQFIAIVKFIFGTHKCINFYDIFAVANNLVP